MSSSIWTGSPRVPKPLGSVSPPSQGSTALRSLLAPHTSHRHPTEPESS